MSATRKRVLSLSQTALLSVVLLLSAVTVVLFPLYAILFQHPAVTALLQETTRSEAIRLATDLSSMLSTGEGPLQRGRLSARLVQQIKTLDQSPHFMKLKLFSPSGEVVHSTDPREIGVVNRQEYFHEIIRTRTPRTREVARNRLSLENQPVASDVVETYVPMLKGDRVVGVFEVYFDITDQKRMLRSLIHRSSAALFGMAIVLLAGVILSTWRAHASLRELKRAEMELRALSLTDELTGLYNRRGFFTLAEQQFKIARRQKKGVLLISADVDRLKRINDTLGHQEGDRALTEIAQVLRETFRESDIIGRLGGDEFLVLQIEDSDCTPGHLAARMEKTLQLHNAKRSRDQPLSLSIGMARCEPEAVCSLHELLAQSDAVMYEQKRAKRKPEMRRPWD